MQWWRRARERAGEVAASTAGRLQPYLRWLEPLSPLVSGIARRLEPVGEFVKNGPLIRFITASLLRRIFVSNLIGLLILLGGYIYLSQQRAWLIEAKTESLKAQGEIIAAAIASNAKVDGQNLLIDPDALPVEGAQIPYRDDGFATLEMVLGPERVTPVLMRLIPITSNRARVYGRDGSLLVDTARIPTLGRLTAPPSDPAADNPRPNTKSFWTRLLQYVSSSDLGVYKEIGSANGMLYPEVREALKGKANPLRQLTPEGEQIVSIAIPVQRNNAVLGVLLLSTRPGEIDDVLAEEYWAIFKIALLALAATIAASWLLARTVAGPMRRLSAAAEHVSRHINARQRLPDLLNRQDEVGQMAQAFTTMTTSLYNRIEASEKFAADVAHELKNPLTAARSTAESLSYARTDEQRDQLVYQIQEELKRLNRLITDVSNASRLDAELARQETEPVKVRILLQGIVDTFRDLLSDDSRKIELNIAQTGISGAFTVEAHAGRLGQVITNLMDNAISFTPEDSTVTVSARRGGQYVEIAIEDEGPGIEPDKLETIFTRFYTYRPTAESSRGNNSGLGLAIAREIIRAHDGDIWAENRYASGVQRDAPGAARPIGARFVVRLPVAGRSKRRNRVVTQLGRHG
jgi:two-component system sensor histidine kinase ChvG